MKKIIISIFLLLALPYMGLPSYIDRWIIPVLLIVLGGSIYIFYKKSKEKEPSDNDTDVEKQTSENSATEKEPSKVTVEKKSPDTQEKNKSLLSSRDREEIHNAVKNSK